MIRAALLATNVRRRELLDRLDLDEVSTIGGGVDGFLGAGLHHVDGEEGVGLLAVDEAGDDGSGLEWGADLAIDCEGLAAVFLDKGTSLDHEEQLTGSTYGAWVGRADALVVRKQCAVRQSPVVVGDVSDDADAN